MSHGSVLALLALALARGDAAPSRRLQSVAPSWTVDTSLHEDTMTLVAIVRVQDVVQASGTLGAFSGGDTRGVSILSMRIPRGPHAGEYCFMLMVYGLAGDTITFRFWDGQTITDMIETEAFVPGSMAGDALMPVLLAAYAANSPPPPPPSPLPALPPTLIVHGWEVETERYYMTMMMIAVVRIGSAYSTTIGASATHGTLAAFHDPDVRGVQDASLVGIPVGTFQGQHCMRQPDLQPAQSLYSGCVRTLCDTCVESCALSTLSVWQTFG